MAIDPIGLIRDFYRDCNCPDWTIDESTINTALLTRDLILLDQNQIDRVSFQGIPPVLLLHGSEDKIVRPERAVELSGIFDVSQLDIIDGAGHGLPFTHPQVCLNLIRDFYKKIC